MELDCLTPSPFSESTGSENRFTFHQIPALDTFSYHARNRRSFSPCRPPTYSPQVSPIELETAMSTFAYSPDNYSNTLLPPSTGSAYGALNKSNRTSCSTLPKMDNEVLEQKMCIDSLLTYMGLGKYIEMFYSKGVDYNKFLDLTEEDLVTIGIHSKRDRCTILDYVKSLGL